MGPPPIRTEKGWLIIYHGIDQFSKSRVYRLGAALISFDDPTHVLWRCNSPILEPQEEYEAVGLIDMVPGGFKALRTMSYEDILELSKNNALPKAVFCCGAILEHDTIRLYYGAGDTRICTATIDLETIFNS